MPQMRDVMKWGSLGSFPFMKMLYPREIEEVLGHSTTLRLSRSIFVCRPRLPTMRVMGSHDMLMTRGGADGVDMWGLLDGPLTPHPQLPLRVEGEQEGPRLRVGLPFWLPLSPRGRG